jgi:Flp pilus assembly pilin Flp
MSPRLSWRNARRRLRGDENGASAVEFAIVGAILVALLLGTIQLGWALQLNNEISKAADAAVRYAALPGKNENDFSVKIKEVLKNYDQSRLVVAAPQQGEVDGIPVWKFKVTYNMPIIVPGVPANMAALTISRWAPDL